MPVQGRILVKHQFWFTYHGFSSYQFIPNCTIDNLGGLEYNYRLFLDNLCVSYAFEGGCSVTINVRQLVKWFFENRGRFVNEFREKLVSVVQVIQSQALEKASLRENALAELEMRCLCHAYTGWGLGVRIYPAERAHARTVGKIALKPCRYSHVGDEGEVEFPVYNPNLLVSNETYQRLRQEVISQFDDDIQRLISERDVAEQRLQCQLIRFKCVFEGDLGEDDLGIILEVLSILKIDLSSITVEEEVPRLRVVSDAA